MTSEAPVPRGADSLRQFLGSAKVTTWFDIGLLLDRLRDDRGWPGPGSADAARWRAEAVQRCGTLGPVCNGPAGAMSLDALVEPWADADGLFAGRLERGGDDYNALVHRLWAQTETLALRIAERVEADGLRALAVGEFWSRPDNLPAALALILVCEHLRLPVFAEHRNGAWRRPQDYRANAHLGEVYTLVEIAFPWDSPWVVHAVPEPEDRDRLVREYGINPAWVLVDGRFESALAAPLAYAAGAGVEAAVEAAHARHLAATGDGLERVARVQRRRYLSGLTPLEYMIRLASLIDPNAFRIEEKTRRGRVFDFAHDCLARSDADADSAAGREFLQACEYLFEWHRGEDELVVDHSLSYRHRHLRHYPHRKLTEPELCGLVAVLAEDLLPAPGDATRPAPEASLLRSEFGCIDARPGLEAALAAGRPVLLIPDSEGSATLIDDLRWLGERMGEASLTVLARAGWGCGSATGSALQAALEDDPHWNDAMAAGRVRVVISHAVSAATHLAQLGEEATAAIDELRAAGGLVLAIGHGNTLSLDCLDVDSWRVGRCADALQASYMDLAPGETYCLWVPAALRPSLAYPTPIQTPREFAAALDSPAWERAVERRGEAAVLAALADDADRYGTPVTEVLDGLLAEAADGAEAALESHRFTGLHSNGEPWSGAYARLRLDAGWHFDTVFAQSRSDTVLDLMAQYRQAGGADAPLAWNGGYILNAELVGKLALPESYIGTPLGLLIDRGRVRSLPLLNKPAMGFSDDGEVVIREANLRAGLSIAVAGGGELVLPATARHRPSEDEPAYFDLFHDGEALELDGRVAFRFAGGRIISVHRDIASLPLLPVGLTVTVPEDQAPAGWSAGVEVEYTLPDWAGISGAIEAGPMLVREGRESIEMDDGGWKTPASIRTQAARLDYTHMRGPKIAVGLSAEHELLVVAINGRIRESVGSTHGEMAKILIDMGAVTAMGFDPGGSVTLVVNGRQLNISPYNRNYMESPLSMPPQPRFVGNAVLAFPP